MRTARCGLAAVLLAFAATCLAGCGALTSRNVSTGCALADTGTMVANDVTGGGASATATTIDRAIDDACAGLAGAAE